MNITEFRKGLYDDINITVEADVTTNPTSEFIKYATNKLIDGEEFDDYIECYYEGVSKNNAKMKIDGYGTCELDNICCIIISEYRDEDEDDSIIASDINSAFNKIAYFVEEAIKYELYKELEESTSVYEFARYLHLEHQNITKFRFFLLTNAYNKQRQKTIDVINIGKIPVERNVWDISRLFDLASSQTQKESIEISLDKGKGIPCVKAVEYNDVLADIEVSTNFDYDLEGTEKKPENIISYLSYLAVVPGQYLNEWYMNYGSKLLEGNVRSFLTVRGKVNKNIQNTIKNYPQMFFAYNNGIAATATEIDVNKTVNGLEIIRIKDLQIVNGGQTTASITNSILTAKKDEKVDISNLFVPMKISVLEHSTSEKIIPKISQYSNSQNKVDESDFFSNHPFHIRMENISRKMAAPNIHGEQYQHFWFYERARGQYDQKKMGLKGAALSKFELRYPKNNKIDLKELARYMEIYKCVPHIVSKGKQELVRDFASDIKKQWDNSNANFNDYYFKRVVAIAIMFSETDNIIQNTKWYKDKKSYKANVIAYTLSVIFNYIRNNISGYEIDFLRIWNNQNLYPELRSQITSLCTYVYRFITSDSRPIENVTQWCKNEKCWELAQKTDWIFHNDFLNSLIREEEIKMEVKLAKSNRKVNNEVDAQNFVLEKGNEYWGKVLAFGKRDGYLTDIELSVIEKISLMNFKRKAPSPKEAKIAISARDKLIENGMPLQFT